MDACLCCTMNIPPTEKKGCPLCGHSLIGQGWVGLDYHWMVRHEMTLPYGTFVEGLCEGHRGAPGVMLGPATLIAPIHRVLPAPRSIESSVTQTPTRWSNRALKTIAYALNAATAEILWRKHHWFDLKVVKAIL